MDKYRIGLIGAPCSGKSTTAAEVFARCKIQGIPAGHVKEYIAELFARGWNFETVSDQMFIYDEQKRREDDFPDHIKVVVTDSPVLLTYFYGVINAKNTLHDRLVLCKLYEYFLSNVSRYNLLVFLERTHDYEIDGVREQNECEANEIHMYLMNLLNIHGIKYKVLPCNTAVDTIMEIIENEVL